MLGTAHIARIPMLRYGSLPLAFMGIYDDVPGFESTVQPCFLVAIACGRTS